MVGVALLRTGLVLTNRRTVMIRRARDQTTATSTAGPNRRSGAVSLCGGSRGRSPFASPMWPHWVAGSWCLAMSQPFAGECRSHVPSRR